MNCFDKLKSISNKLIGLVTFSSGNKQSKKNKDKDNNTSENGSSNSSTVNSTTNDA